MTDSATADPAPQAGGGEAKRDVTYAYLVVFFGIAAVTVAQMQGIGLIPLKNLLKNELHESKAATAAFFFWIGLAWYFKPFFGIFTDAFPLFGTRRKSYILLGATLSVLGFIALINTPHNYAMLLAVCVIINVFMVITSTATGGFMTEKAQAMKASGGFASIFQIAYQMASIAGGPLGGLLAAVAFGWTGAASAAVMFLPIPAALLFLKEKRIRVDREQLLADAGAQFKKIAAAKTMWAAAGFSFLFYFAPGIQTALFYRQQTVIGMSTEQQGVMLLINGVFAVFTATIYGTVLARRFTLRKLLFGCILAGGLAQMCYAFYNTMTDAYVVEALWGLGWAAADMSLSDLYMRSAPKGSEALGFSLMVSVRNLSLFGADWLGSAAMDAYHLKFSTMAIANGAISLVALPFVFLLSGRVVDRRDSAEEAAAIPPIPAGKAIIDEA